MTSALWCDPGVHMRRPQTQARAVAVRTRPVPLILLLTCPWANEGRTVVGIGEVKPEDTSTVVIYSGQINRHQEVLLRPRAAISLSESLSLTQQTWWGSEVFAMYQPEEEQGGPGMDSREADVLSVTPDAI